MWTRKAVKERRERQEQAAQRAMAEVERRLELARLRLEPVKRRRQRRGGIANGTP